MRELEHFRIGDSYGGNQDWFPTFMMRIGGCGAETACDSSVYFALHKGLTGIAPENAARLTKKDYVRFAYEMRSYLYPRARGIDRPEIYVDGYARYLADRGETRLTMTCLPGTEPYGAAREAVVRRIDGGYPVPALVLSHRNRALEDYVWHWFLLNGYDDEGDAFRVKAVTYGKYEWLDFAALWDTGYARRGGLVLYRIDGEGAEDAFRIRPSAEEDLPRMLEIYARARRFMAEHGNPDQWGPTNWPPEALLRRDIAEGKSRVCEHEGRVVGTFFFDRGKDVEPTYRVITDGSWRDGSPYGVVHRLASDGTVKGVGAYCLDWAFAQCGHLRIDTHGDNAVMQALLDKKGFARCGIIHVEEDGFPRIAYEKL